MCTCLCMFIWRPEVKIRYLPLLLSILFFILIFILFHVYGYLTYLPVMTMEARWGNWIYLNWSDRCLWASVQVLETVQQVLLTAGPYLQHFHLIFWAKAFPEPGTHWLPRLAASSEDLPISALLVQKGIQTYTTRLGSMWVLGLDWLSLYLTPDSFISSSCFCSCRIHSGIYLCLFDIFE